jgi:hypothetical protein
MIQVSGDRRSKLACNKTNLWDSIKYRGLVMIWKIFNNRLIPALILSYSIINIAIAADTPLLIRNWSDDEPKITVEDSRDNIFKEQIENIDILKKTPEKCLATVIADIEHKIIWQPKWYYSGAGTVRIPEAVISPDKSALAIIENIGKPGAPSSSRIILLNLYNFKILRIIELPEKLLTMLCYIPNTNQIIGIVDRQKSLKQSSGFMVIDLTGKLAPRKIKTSKKIAAVDCSPKKLFIAFADGSLEYFDLTDLTASSIKINLFGKITALAYHSTTNRLLATSSGKLNYLKLSTMAADIYAETSISKNFRPDKIIITDASGNCALLENKRRFMLVRNRQSRHFDIIPDVAADMNKNRQLLAIGIRHKQQLQLYNLPGAEKLKPCEPKKITPRTSGDITILTFIPEPMEEIIKTAKAPVINKSKNKKKTKKRKVKPKKKTDPAIRLLIVDSHGNIYKLEHYKRRWRKELLIEPKK